MKRKTAVMGALFLILVMLVGAGCGSAGAPSTASNQSGNNAPTAKEPTTIVWSYWGDPWEVDLNKKVAAAFEAKNPDIKIVQQWAPWSNYFDKLETQWAGGTSPDVMFLTNIQFYAAKGVLMDLMPLIKKNNFNLGDFPPKLLETWKSLDGTKLWGAPRDNDTKVIYYNKKLFDEAKLKYPSTGWTWADLRADAEKLTKRQGSVTTQYGFAFETGTWRLWVWMNGGDLFDNPAHPTKSVINTPQAAEAIQFLSDLINKDKVTPPYDQLKSSATISALFQSGKLGMAWGNAALIPSFLKNPDLKWDVAPMPKAKPDLPVVNIAGGAGYTISAKTKHPNAAFRFWSFLSGPEAQGIFASSGLIVPATKGGQESDAFSKGKPYNVKVFIDGTADGHPAPTWAYFPKAHQLMDVQIQKALVGDTTGAVAVQKAAQAADEYIKNPR